MHLERGKLREFKLIKIHLCSNNLNIPLLMTKEEIIASKIKELKSLSGSHSPSIETVLQSIPEIEMQIDACFLSNPYATDLFLEYLQGEVLHKHHFRRMLEYYPPQNKDISKHIESFAQIDYRNILVGNGAIEIIQAIIHRFTEKNIALPIPTFSSYYEFVREDCQVHTFQLKKEENYQLDLERYSQFIIERDIDTAVIINPSNPTAEYITKDAIVTFLDRNKHLRNIILDISFVHFAYENDNFDFVNFEQLVLQYPNLVLVKSMSKDFGIAGIRAGYGIMSADKVAKLLKNGYLWNSSGLAAYFFQLFAQKEFQLKYEEIRKKYIAEARVFFNELHSLDSIKVLPSKANFALIEIPEYISSFDFTIEMLASHNIYVRDCSDKIGLDGSYVRIAARSKMENERILSAINSTTKKFR